MGACWSPDSRSVLLAFANSKQLAMLYLLGPPPSLQAQLLPVQLPELESAQGSSGQALNLLRARFNLMEFENGIQETIRWHLPTYLEIKEPGIRILLSEGCRGFVARYSDWIY